MRAQYLKAGIMLACGFLDLYMGLHFQPHMSRWQITTNWFFCVWCFGWGLWWLQPGRDGSER